LPVLTWANQSADDWPEPAPGAKRAPGSGTVQ